MSNKPITLWGHAAGPNPWKVALILEELGVPYDQKFLEFADLKKDPYESLNPNGRVPAVEDPNTGIVVWESASCIDYLLEEYDTSNKLTPTERQAKIDASSWRDFQISGQGPYFGQAVWFSKYHAEKVQSAVDRYKNEVRRIVGVIDRHLAKKQTTYLTGNQITYADLMFVTWNSYLGALLPEGTDLEKEFSTFNAWWQKLSDRPAVKKIFADQKAAMAAASH